ncbi:MAG TPA: serine/threonine-protein kinase, partial [Candidatus Xenobia bacterium]
MLSTGAVLQGRYRIERVLGRGGMGAVYLAIEEQLGNKRVAIKEMRIDIDNPTERQQAIDQFYSEARILATLDHPNLVDVTHYFEEKGKQYLVMAFIDGKTLEALVNETQGYLPVASVVNWMDQIGDVLEYLHGHDPPIIFRDMKPSNVMLDTRSRIRLIDFGIARSFDSGKTKAFIKGVGTDGFAPLEQYGQSGTTDARTDIYAWGATIYALLTRSIPPSAVDLATREAVLAPPCGVNPEVSPALEQVLATMMALHKDDRYPSVALAREALKGSMLEAEPAQGPPRLLARGGGLVPGRNRPVAPQPERKLGTSRAFLQSRPGEEASAASTPELRPRVIPSPVRAVPNLPEELPISHRPPPVGPPPGPLVVQAPTGPQMEPPVTEGGVLTDLDDSVLAAFYSERLAIKAVLQASSSLIDLLKPSNKYELVKVTEIDADHLVFVTTQAYRTGSIVQMRISLPQLGEGKPVQIDVRVNLLDRSQVAQAFRFRGTFRDLSPETKGILANANHLERRKYRRFSQKFQVLARQLPAGARGLAVDLSVAGIGLLVGGMVPLGALLDLTLDLEDTTNPGER